MSSLTEEILGFTDLVMQFLAAQQAYFASRQETDKQRWLKLRGMVEQVAKEIHQDHRGVAWGDGKQERML